MSEYLTVWQVSIGGLGLVIGSSLYSFGGRSGKWLRRFLASFILTATVNGLCAWRGIWSPWMLVVWPILIGGFSLGYGAEKMGVKVMKRSLVVAAILFSGILMAGLIRGHAWFILPLQVGVSIWSVWLGVKNPVEASAEEFFVALLLCLPLMMYPFV